MGAEMAELANRYETGQKVRVRMNSSGPNPRTPLYLRGKVGTIETLHGATYAPHDHRGVYPYLYTVSFEVSELTGKPSKDRVKADLHEEWLDPA
jgi:nitrile hydratase